MVNYWSEDFNWQLPAGHFLTGVQTQFKNTTNGSEKIQIENAISAFHMSTCIRFVTRTDQTDYISIVKQSGCWSWVGRIGKSQELSLGAGCLQKGIIQHELIHALGFWHEQSRNDRDAFVKINFGNILQGQERNFGRWETNNLNVPYDYGSVMHYAPTDFSKNSGHTIVPLDSSAQIGQRDGMSENDILKINKLYVCTDYLHAYAEWDNTLENTFSRTCPNSQAVSGVTSLYNNDKKDRLWAFSCKAFKLQRACKWSKPMNEHWESNSFKCGENEVIAGVYSDRSNLFKDRKWSFQCCSSPGFTTSNCQTVTNINYYEEYFSWTVASDHFLTGVASSFDSSSRVQTAQKTSLATDNAVEETPPAAMLLPAALMLKWPGLRAKRLNGDRGTRKRIGCK
ncbi:zinc metalloproteinase nas-8-like [Clinocottus analis]|uniref:zinc metalloproteinase nas-8-like n=1 Tax=Clinocottus analis TaxID=304258 RepID=UPI0035C0906A